MAPMASAGLPADRYDRLVQRQAADRRAGRKGAQQPAGHGGGQDDEAAPVLRPPYQPAEGLRHPRPDQPVVISRSEEHTSELQSLMRISYAVFCLKKKNKYN